MLICSTSLFHSLSSESSADLTPLVTMCAEGAGFLLTAPSPAGHSYLRQLTKASPGFFASSFSLYMVIILHRSASASVGKLEEVTWAQLEPAVGLAAPPQWKVSWDEESITFSLPALNPPRYRQEPPASRGASRSGLGPDVPAAAAAVLSPYPPACRIESRKGSYPRWVTFHSNSMWKLGVKSTVSCFPLVDEVRFLLEEKGN